MPDDHITLRLARMVDSGSKVNLRSGMIDGIGISPTICQAAAVVADHRDGWSACLSEEAAADDHRDESSVCWLVAADTDESLAYWSAWWSEAGRTD